MSSRDDFYLLTGFKRGPKKRRVKINEPPGSFDNVTRVVFFKVFLSFTTMRAILCHDYLSPDQAEGSLICHFLPELKAALNVNQLYLLAASVLL